MSTALRVFLLRRFISEASALLVVVGLVGQRMLEIHMVVSCLFGSRWKVKQKAAAA
jgi:hypothetical protein